MMLVNAQADFPPETYKQIAEIMKKYPQARELMKKRLTEMTDNLDQLKKVV